MSLCKGYSKQNPVPISGIEPGIFRRILHYLYGGVIPVSELRSRPRAFLEAADRFELTSLKVQSEVELVKSNYINVENVVDVYLYAVAMSCPLLRRKLKTIL